MMLGLAKAKVSEISRESEYRMGKTRYKWEGADLSQFVLDSESIYGQ